MKPLQFTDRSALGDYEWNHEKKEWIRPPLDRDVLKSLTKRSDLIGVARVLLFLAFLGGSAAMTVWVAGFSLWGAIPWLYLYFFFYGFWVAIAHELQHKTVFGKWLEGPGEVLFFFIQAMIWNSPRYARISHQLHHRYTMVHGMDPETAWPRVITRRWLRRHFLAKVSKVLIVGAVVQLVADVIKQLSRVLGFKDAMMRDHCRPADLLVIRLESAAILVVHAAVVTWAVATQNWFPLAFVTIAWQVGSGIEGLWHQTEHIGRMCDVNEMRLNTRDVKVSWFLNLIYWGLDDHVDHHLYPAVPSHNLPKLHAILAKDLAFPKNVVDCWAEMFAIAREKERNPNNEFVPVSVPLSWSLRKKE